MTRILLTVLVGVVAIGFIFFHKDATEQPTIPLVEPVLGYSPQYGINDGLIAYWTFDKRQHDFSTNALLDPDTIYRLTDWSGNGHFATSTFNINSSFVRGKVGQTFDLSGSSQYFLVNHTTTLEATTTLTIAFWANPDVGTAGIYDSGEHASAWFIRHFTDRIRFNDGTSVRDSSGATVPTGTWTHCIITINGTGAGAIRFYFNGTFDSASTLATLVTPSGSKQIGAFNGSSFNGRLDEFRIYNRVLSDEEIRTLYRMGLTGNPR